MNKYRARKTVVDGITFDSAKEARRYSELKLMARAGEIADLAWQTKFPLLVNGVKVADYVADFTYSPNGGSTAQIEVEDVKSPITRTLPLYRLKSRMFTAQYGFSIKEV